MSISNDNFCYSGHIKNLAVVVVVVVDDDDDDDDDDDACSTGLQSPLGTITLQSETWLRHW